MKTFNILILFAAIPFVACKTQGYTPTQLPERQIVFGKGGGVSGEITEYILLENGQVFRSSSFSGKMVELRKIEKKQARQFFEQIAGLQLDKEKFDHPGNMYYFITYKTPDNPGKVVWGNRDNPVRENIQNFYDSLISIIQSK